MNCQNNCIRGYVSVFNYKSTIEDELNIEIFIFRD